MQTRISVNAMMNPMAKDRSIRRMESAAQKPVGATEFGGSAFGLRV